MKKKIVILFLALLALGWLVSISAILNDPKDYEAHIEKAEELEKKEIYIDAITEYQEALAYSGDNVELLRRMANDYLMLNETSEYVSTLEKAIELEQDGSEEALDDLMQYYIDQNAVEKAVQYVYEYTQTSPDVEYVQKWFLELKGSYKELYCRYDEMQGIYNDYMVVKSGDFYSITDASGSRLLDVEYTELTPFFSNEYARTVNSKGNVIYIDTDGRTRVVPDEKYDNLGVLNDSRIAASLKGKYGYLDENGEPVTDFQWEDITAFNDVGAAKLDGKWAIINEKGKEKTEYIYDDIITDEYGIACRQSRLFAQTDKKYQLISNKGKEISSEKFDDAKVFTEDGYAAVCKKGKWGFVNVDGELIIDYQYDDALSFANGYAAVCIDGLWGYIDTDNNLIIDADLLEATSFSSEGSAAVKVQVESEDEEQTAEWHLIKLNIES